MKLLPIVWQRLVTADGEACERGGNTYIEMLHAVEILRQELHPLGIKPVLCTRTISENEFKAHPKESTRIWICNKSLEEWLGAEAVESQYCADCDDASCQMRKINSMIFESVSLELILKAGLKAAAML